jgi:hypothetical protein
VCLLTSTPPPYPCMPHVLTTNTQHQQANKPPNNQPIRQTNPTHTPTCFVRAKVMEVEGAGAAEDDSSHRYSKGGECGWVWVGGWMGALVGGWVGVPRTIARAVSRGRGGCTSCERGMDSVCVSNSCARACMLVPISEAPRGELSWQFEGGVVACRSPP